MYYVYKKEDIKSGGIPLRTYTSPLDAQSFALKASSNNDIVLLKVDQLHFRLNSTPSTDHIYHTEGVIDVNFFPKKRTIQKRPTYNSYSHYGTGFFNLLYHNFGVLARLFIFSFIIFTFVSSLQPNTLTVMGLDGHVIDVGVMLKQNMDNTIHFGNTMYENIQQNIYSGLRQ